MTFMLVFFGFSIGMLILGPVLRLCGVNVPLWLIVGPALVTFIFILGWVVLIFGFGLLLNFIRVPV
jgi:RsiW-degrading membrane proteinase PrsW (M82 family)